MASWRCWSATSGRDGVSPEDLADVYRSTYRALVRFLYRKVWDAERAEDLAQEAFARALVHKPENARGWLFVVAANMARDCARRAARGAGAASPDALEERATGHLPAVGRGSAHGQRALAGTRRTGAAHAARPGSAAAVGFGIVVRRDRGADGAGARRHRYDPRPSPPPPGGSIRSEKDG